MLASNDGYHVDGGRKQVLLGGATTISHYFPQHLASTSKLFRAPCYARYPAANLKLSQVCSRKRERHGPSSAHGSSLSRSAQLYLERPGPFFRRS